MFSISKLIAAAVILAASVPSCAQSVVGQVLVVRGKVTVARARQPVQSYFQLKQGDLMTIDQSSSASIVLYGSGERYGLAPNSAVKIESGKLVPVKGQSPQIQAPLRIGVRKQGGAALAQDRIQENQRIGGEIEREMQRGPAPRKLKPFGALRGGRVTLQWKLPHASARQSAGAALRLEMRRAGVKRSQQLVLAADLPADARAYPVTPNKLAPGVWYYWTVTIVGGDYDGRKGSSMFRLLTPGEKEAVAQAERETQAYNKTADAEIYALMLAQLYADVDLYAEAIQEYASILQKNPLNKGARQALDDLRAAVQPSR